MILQLNHINIDGNFAYVLKSLNKDKWFTVGGKKVFRCKEDSLREKRKSWA